MFRYFPKNMMWSQAVMIALNSGGEIGEIDQACRTILEAGDRADGGMWHEAWKKLAEKVRGQAEADERAGHRISAANKYHRACAYYVCAERFVEVNDPRKLETYHELRATFQKLLETSRAPVERVEVPYEGTSLPALFVPAPGDGRKPTLIFVDGFDIMKEIIYLRRIDQAGRRGISLLIVDTPGVGEALRLRNMPTRFDTEVPVGACVDYLQTRGDVDPNRIGVMGISLGGYYAPRAAAFEKRLKCCIAWGAIWDGGKVFRRLFGGDVSNLSVPPFQLLWVTGTKSRGEGLAYMDKMTLEGIADRITCPLLVIHGEHDHLVPLELAERTVKEAVSSPRADLRVMRAEEGGDEHCQMDNIANGIDVIYDWAADVLK